MLVRRSWDNHPRRGAYLVEFALVVWVFFLFLFGVIEYGRLVWAINMLDNAAREGARLAVVNTSQGSTLTSLVQTEVDNRLAGVKTMFVGYSKTSAIVVAAVDPTTGNQLLDSSNNPIPPESTQFGQAIQVQVSVTYQPFLPSLLFLPTSMHLVATSEMRSEAN